MRKVTIFVITKKTFDEIYPVMWQLVFRKICIFAMNN